MKIREGLVASALLISGAVTLGSPLDAMAGSCAAVRFENDNSGDVPPLSEQTEPTPVRIAGPFDVPWSVGFLPNGSLLVTERPGHLQHIWPSGQRFEITGIPHVLYSGHGGLLDIAVDPDYGSTGEVYFSYLTGDDGASVIRVVRAKLDEQNEALSDSRVIFESKPGARPEMVGARIALTGDGYLFLSLGDRWARDLAQDLSKHEGKIIRIRTDGSIPPDNPFVNTPGALPEIWSYGHRNPEGLSFDRATGELWEHEHGPQGGDELNIVERGHNYGWPVITYGVDYSGRPIGIGTSQDGMDQPINYWAPISIAPSGLAIENKDGGQVAWIGALAGQMLEEVTLQGHCATGEQRYLKNALGRIRDVRFDSKGSLYVLTDGGDAMLYRIDPAPSDVEIGMKTRP